MPTADDCDLIVEILQGRQLPQRSLLAEADERESRADRLTVEQATILGVTRLLNRVEMRGGAGSGKTLLALTQAKEVTRGRHGMPRQRVALLCYSVRSGRLVRAVYGQGDRQPAPGLRRDLRGPGGIPRGDGVRRTRRHRLLGEPAARGRWPSWCGSCRTARSSTRSSWTRRRTSRTPGGRRSCGCLRDEENGGVFVYSDENQRVFARFGRPPVPLVPLVLDHNLRNTRQIARRSPRWRRCGCRPSAETARR